MEALQAQVVPLWEQAAWQRVQHAAWVVLRESLRSSRSRCRVCAHTECQSAATWTNNESLVRMGSCAVTTLSSLHLGPKICTPPPHT